LKNRALVTPPVEPTRVHCTGIVYINPYTYTYCCVVANCRFIIIYCKLLKVNSHSYCYIVSIHQLISIQFETQRCARHGDDVMSPVPSDMKSIYHTANVQL